MITMHDLCCVEHNATVHRSTGDPSHSTRPSGVIVHERATCIRPVYRTSQPKLVPTHTTHLPRSTTAARSSSSPVRTSCCCLRACSRCGPRPASRPAAGCAEPPWLRRLGFGSGFQSGSSLISLWSPSHASCLDLGIYASCAGWS